MINLNHLAIFHVVAQERSVSKAADCLLVSQPAVSKQLSELERSLATPLFDRLPRGMRPTQAGELLANYARRVFALVEETERGMDELRGLKRGRLSVGASTTLGVYFLPAIFVRYRRAYPGVELHLEIADSSAIAQKLISGSIDIGLTEGQITNELCESTAFMEDRLVAIAPIGHPLTRRKSVSPEMLCREPFVVRETGSSTKSLVERALADRGLSVKSAMSLGSTEAIKQAVAAGMGIAIISSLAASLELRAGQLATIKVRGLSIRRPLYRVELRGAHRTRATSAFTQFILEHCTSGEKLRA